MSKLSSKTRPNPVHLGMIETAYLIRECAELKTGGDATIGEMIDTQIALDLQAGKEVQSITLHLAEESRANLAAMYPSGDPDQWVAID